MDLAGQHLLQLINTYRRGIEVLGIFFLYQRSQGLGHHMPGADNRLYLFRANPRFTMTSADQEIPEQS